MPAKHRRPRACTAQPDPVAIAEPAAVTLAANWRNVTLLTASALLADTLKLGIDRLLTLAPQADPSSWLPAELRVLAPTSCLLQHVDWQEPRFFRALPYEGEVYYYRVADELLCWLAADGSWHQLTTL
jgi:hypothetical protein